VLFQRCSQHWSVTFSVTSASFFPARWAFSWLVSPVWQHLFPDNWLVMLYISLMWSVIQSLYI
jgi:hypothetical protein